MDQAEEKEIKKKAIQYIKDTYNKEYEVSDVTKDFLSGQIYTVEGNIKDDKNTYVAIIMEQNEIRDTYVETLWTEELKPKITSGAYDKLIRNYRFNDDVVGSVGYRLGETYDIDKDGKVTLDEGLDNKLNINVLSGSHGISNFTTGYDEDTKEKLDTPIPNLYEKNNGNIAPRE